MKLNPQDYEYIWTDHEVNYIFVSCYLFKEFRETDFVLIHDWQAKGVKFFLSKKDKERHSNFGVKFYEKYFPQWKKKIAGKIALGKELVEQTKREENAISSMTNEEIKKKFLERVNLFQELGGLYFYTEFFFLDKVEKIVKEKGENHGIITNNLEQMGKIKLEAREVLNNFYNYRIIFRPYVEEIGKRTGRKDLLWLSFQEICEIIEGKEVPVSNREKEDWVLAKLNDWGLIKGKEAVTVKENFDAHFFGEDVNIIKGVIANKGICRGKVKIIRTLFSDTIEEEIKKVEKGDILVANTTGPEVMAACERAGAIVTDEGGITSHAAIVSRELKIPCIVGTKIASQVFKDNDLVEVDANKGIIKKLK